MAEAAKETRLLTLKGVIGDMAKSVSSAVRGFEQMYKPAEPVFGAVARQMVARGWSVFPQELDGNRRPGRAAGEIIRWSEDHALADHLPSPEALELWIRECSTLNVATVFGPASGNSLALDIDVLDHELSARLVDLADSILGRTPFRRIGLAPKIALIYRHAPDATIHSVSRRFADEGQDGGMPDGDGVEVLSRGKLLTFWGKHHKTGRYFVWPDLNPFDHGPDEAPEVTPDQVGEWLEACDSVRRFHRGASYDMAAVDWEWDESAGLHVPKIANRGGGIEWVEDDDGRVVDGREAYLSNLVYRACKANKPACGSESGRTQIMAMVLDQFLAHAEVSGRWSPGRLEREVRTKVIHMARKVASGEVKNYAPVIDAQGKYVAAASNITWIPPRPTVQGEVDSLDFMPQHADPDRHATNPYDAPRAQIKCVVRPLSDAARRARAIPADRTDAMAAVQDGLCAAFDEFFERVYARDPNSTSSAVDILKAPTGAGKTSQAIRYIARDPRTKRDYPYLADDGTLQRGRCPILFLLPTYNNIDELRARSQVLNLDPDLPDENFRARAVELGLMHEDDVDAKVVELRRDAENAGLKTMVYKGKIAAGCQMADKVKIAMEAGVGTAGFCRTPTRNKDGTPGEDRFCEFYHGCPAIQQRDLIKENHVVFMPHPFMALTIPEELKHVRAVVADERIHHLFLHTTTLKLRTLSGPRRLPRLSRRERDKGEDPIDFLRDREVAADIVRKAFDKRGCPAQALLLAQDPKGNSERYGFRLVESALKVCSSAIQRDANITPDLTLEEVQELCAMPTGEEVREEYRFWMILQERMQALMQDGVNGSRISALQAVLADEIADDNKKEAARRELSHIRQAKGDKDYRIQLQEDIGETGEVELSVRISWRQEPNWSGIPLLLLDASAAPDVIRKIWKGAEVRVHDIGAPLNVRVVGVVDRTESTFSNASIIGPEQPEFPEEIKAARRLARVRRAISLISSMYGWGRVVAGGSIAVRRAVNHEWAGPDNVDWCHYGAMRGLDFAKFHAAAVSIGRMEVPVRAIDGLVAALTYDDNEPEQPLDRFGTGKTEDGKDDIRLPMGTQVLKMRSGHDIEIAVPTFPGRWGRLMQRQYREEEQVQFLGRLRPVYRQGEAPIWFALSSVIPDDVIVDDLITLDNLLSTRKAQESYKKADLSLWEAARRTRGVLEPEIVFKACPDLYKSADAVLDEMEVAGMYEVSGECVGRLSWGFSPVRFRWYEDEGTRHAFVRSDIADRGAALVRASEEHLDHTPCDIVELPKGRETTLARGRTVPDKVEEFLGTADERRDEEADIVLAVAEWAFENGLRHHFTTPDRDGKLMLPVKVPVCKDGDKSIMMTYAEMEAMESTRRLRRKLATEKAEAGASEIEIPGAATLGTTDGNFDHLDAGASDGHATDREEAEIPW